jgi:hypothetical protein
MERRALRTERAGDHWFLRISSRYNKAPQIGFNPPSPTHSNTKLRTEIDSTLVIHVGMIDTCSELESHICRLSKDNRAKRNCVSCARERERERQRERREGDSNTRGGRKG